MSAPSLFLASGSPRRRELLEKAHIPFSIISNHYDESGYHFDQSNLPASIAELAALKAQHSQAQYKGLILGADTIVVLDQQLLGKPADLDQAKTMLRRLSGKTHQVITGIALWDTTTQNAIKDSVTTQVTFRDLSDGDIHDYVSNYEVLDKAGAYAIQDIGHRFVTDLNGEMDNVIGLPMKTVLSHLENYGILGR